MTPGAGVEPGEELPHFALDQFANQGRFGIELFAGLHVADDRQAVAG